MNIKTFFSGNVFNKIINMFLIAAVLILFLVPDAKSWLLQQLVTTGWFKAHIEKDAGASTKPESPAFSFKEADGNIVDTKELKGKVIFINFWASWCPPCRAEMPSLNALYEKFKNDDRLVFVFLNEDDDKAKATTYIQQKKLDIPMYVPHNPIPAELFSGTLPTTIIIDKGGKIVLRHEGIANYHTTDFINQLKSLL